MTVKLSQLVGSATQGVSNTNLKTAAGDLGGAWLTFVPAPTGFTGDESVTVARATNVGKSCTMTIGFVGTSNATTCTFTLPFAAKSGNSAQHIVRVKDNGTSAVGLLIIGTTTATLYSTATTGAAFTASGSKQLYPSTITYEMA